MPHTPSYHDAEIIQQISEGDESAFYQFYKEYAPRLRSYLLKTTQSQTDTEEILQSAFIRVWLSRDKLPGIENVSAWLYTITARLYLQQYRNKKREQHKIVALAKEQKEEPYTPLDLLQMDEVRKGLQQVVHNMPDNRKTIFRMNREAGKKPAEIASALGMPVGTVKNHLTAANKEIRTFLMKEGYTGFALLYIFIVRFPG